MASLCSSRMVPSCPSSSLRCFGRPLPSMEVLFSFHCQRVFPPPCFHQQRKRPVISQIPSIAFADSVVAGRGNVLSPSSRRRRVHPSRRPALWYGQQIKTYHSLALLIDLHTTSSPSPSSSPLVVVAPDASLYQQNQPVDRTPWSIQWHSSLSNAILSLAGDACSCAHQAMPCCYFPTSYAAYGRCPLGWLYCVDDGVY